MRPTPQRAGVTKTNSYGREVTFMKTLVVYYSYKGRTKVFAEGKAKELGAETLELVEYKRRGFIRLFLGGVPAAVKGKKDILMYYPASADKYTQYDKIVICMPIWNGHPAPAFNNIVEVLPEGKPVELYMLSKSADTSKNKEAIIAKITAKGCEVIAYTDVNGKEIPKPKKVKEKKVK